MKLPVYFHIDKLKQVIERLQNRKTGTTDKISLLMLDIAIQKAQLGIVHYELALRIESELEADKQVKAASASR